MADSNQFNQAAQNSQKQQQQATQQRQSEQVKKTQLGLQGGPKPPGSTRAAVDRQAHNQQKAKDDLAAKKDQKLELLKQFEAKQKAANKAREGKTKGKDLGR